MIVFLVPKLPCGSIDKPTPIQKINLNEFNGIGGDPIFYLNWDDGRKNMLITVFVSVLRQNSEIGIGGNHGYDVRN